MELDTMRDQLAKIAAKLDPAYLSKLVALAKLILEAQRQGIEWPTIHRKFIGF